MSETSCPLVLLLRFDKARQVLAEAGFEVADYQVTRPPRERKAPGEPEKMRVVRQREFANKVHLVLCPMD